MDLASFKQKKQNSLHQQHAFMLTGIIFKNGSTDLKKPVCSGRSQLLCVNILEHTVKLLHLVPTFSQLKKIKNHISIQYSINIIDTDSYQIIEYQIIFISATSQEQDILRFWILEKLLLLMLNFA